MSDKLIVVVSSGEKQKALTGLTFAMRTLQEGWMEDVKVFIFGPAQNLMVIDHDVQKLAKVISEAEAPVACKAISDRDGISEQLCDLGIEVDFVGRRITSLIKQGYTPMVF